MNYKRVCLYCGEPNDGLSYSCTCNKEGWINQYRVIDLDMELHINRQIIKDSFQNYSFSNPEGLLQYKGLPFHHIMPNISNAPGLTPLYELSNLSINHHCTLFLKDEGANPSGCFKDRETVLCMLNSQYNNINKAVIYSSGNAAASAAYNAEQSGHRLVTFVAGDTYSEKIDYIRSHGTDVIIIGDSQTNFETGYRLFSEMNEKRTFARLSYDNWSVRNPFRVQGDKTIALEIIKQLSEDEPGTIVPDFVIAPTANGSCLAGIWKGFRELKRAGIIATLPRMISAGIKNANPVAKAVRLRQTDQPVRCNLAEVATRDREVGSTIVAEEGYDSIEAARAVLQSGGFEVELHTQDIENALIKFLEVEEKLAIGHQLLPEPASFTSLAAVGKIQQRVSLSPDDIVVSISTGDGQKAEHLLTSLLTDKPVLQEIVSQIIKKKETTNHPSFTTQGQQIHTEANIEAITEAFHQMQKQPA